LDAAVHQGTFRKDLYFRLNVVCLRIPALRERRNDIPMMVNHFVEKFKPQERGRLTVSAEAMNKLMSYEWPGNVRELENCIERAVALGSGPVLQSSDLTTNVQYGSAQHGRAGGGTAGSFTATATQGGSGMSSYARTSFQSEPGFVPVIRNSQPASASGAGVDPSAALERIVPLADIEKNAILSAIQETGGDKLLAAKLLGIGKTTLYRKIKEWGVSKTSAAASGA